MDNHINKAGKLAKKALGLFDLAILGLEKANKVLVKGTQKVEGEMADLLQDKAKLEEKLNHAGCCICEHDNEVAKNLKKIEKLKAIFGE